MVPQITLIMPFTATIINIPTIPHTICLLPSSFLEIFSPEPRNSTIPYRKTMTATLSIKPTTGFKTFFTRLSRSGMDLPPALCA